MIEAPQDEVEDLDRPWPLQSDQGLLDAIDERVERSGMDVIARLPDRRAAVPQHRRSRAGVERPGPQYAG